jgi:peptidoglycan-N-acetylglucosamine deacetylase
VTTRVNRRDFGLGTAAAAMAAVAAFEGGGAARAREQRVVVVGATCEHVPSGCGVPGVFSHGSRAGTDIALTFDACPTSHKPSFAAEVADYLEQERVAATFFVSGIWAEANSEALVRLARVGGFEIALHGHRHPRLINASHATIRAEIEDGRAALIGLGVEPLPLFRPPFGDLPPALPAIAQACGVLPVTWDAALGDPDPVQTAEVMERDAIRWVQAGSIILMHINGGGYATAEAARALVPLFKGRGFTFVGMRDLVRRSGTG